MNLFRLLSLSACVVAIPLLASCNVSKPVSATFSVTPAPSGEFEVVALEQVKQDSVRTMLGFNEWRFDLKASPADKYVTCIVEFQQKGKPPRKLSHFTIFTNITPHQKVNIGMMPVGTTVSSNDGWKIMLRTENANSLMVVGNPLRGKMSSIRGGVPEELSKNSFILMTARDLQETVDPPLAAEAAYKIVVKFVPSQKEWKPGQPLTYQSELNAE